MSKGIKLVLSLAIIVSSFALAKKPDIPLVDRPKDNKVQVLTRGVHKQVPFNILEEKRLVPSRALDSDIVPLDKVRPATVTEGDRHLALWDLKHVDDTAEWYLGSGDQNDTMVVAFTPAAPCIVKEVYHQWFDGGNIIAWGAMLSDEGVANTVNGASTSWPRGTANFSPIGEQRTPMTPNTIDDYVSDWSLELDIGIVGHEFVVGDSTDLSAVETFLIVFVKTSAGGGPHPLASDVSDDTYLWFGGPWMGADCANGNGDWGDGYCWGAYQSSGSMGNGLIDNMVLVKVEYPWGAPISITAMNQLNNTYYTGKTETITVNLFDDVDETSGMAIDANDVVTYYYVFQGDTTSGNLTAANVGADGNGDYTFDITYSGASEGDLIEYWVEATDNDNLPSENTHLFFEVKAPSNPDADLLVVRDRVSSRQRDLVEQVLDDMGFVYEIWDSFDENGIDASVIAHGWSNIIAYGWGNMTVPILASENDPGYANFIDNGGNLFLCDMDWFYGHFPDLPTLTFNPGDFAYDYFGLAAGVNDPGPDDTVAVTGVGVTPIDNPFTVDPLVLRHAPYLLTDGAGWIDYLTAGTATELFFDDLGNLVGTVLDHSARQGGKAVYLSFMADAAGDTIPGGDWDYTQFSELMDGLITYFGILSPPVVNLVGEGSTRYGVASGTGSATINAKAYDADGSLTAVNLKWTVDGGVENSTAMNLVNADDYTATITLTGFTDASTVVYWAEATDNDALTTLTSTGAFWGTSFVPSGAAVLYMQDHYAPWGPNGADDADAILQANLTAAGIAFDRWVVWDNDQADYATVLSNYEAVVYAGVFDWLSMPENSADHTLTEFVDGGGYLLFSSEEVLGTYTGWEDITFSPGHFVYDVLGVEWVGNDWNYEAVAVNDDGGTGLISGITVDDIPLDISFMPVTASMADLCDPLFYGTADQLPSPFLGNPGFYYYGSSINGTTAFLAFNISMLPTAEQQQLLANFVDWANTSVTIALDMSNETVAPEGVHIAGNMQGWDAGTTEMTDPDGDGVYEVTFEWLTPGETLLYTFINGNTWNGQEDNTGLADCGVDNGFGAYNRIWVVGDADEYVGPVCFSSCIGCDEVYVTFQVDMTNEDVSADGVHIAGSMQGWDPGATEMTDDDGDGVYEVTLALTSGETVFYKYINGNSWGNDETVPSDCADGGNRSHTVGTFDEVIDAVCFASCIACEPPNYVEATVTFQADMTNLIELGFDPASGHTIDVRGSFDGWGSGIALQPDLLDPELYVGNVTFTENVGNEVFWKFKANPDADWNNTGWELGDNHALVWTGLDIVIDPPMVPDILPVGEDLLYDVTISFSVEWCDGTLNANTGLPFPQKPDTLVFNGSFLAGWYTWGDCMEPGCELLASPDMPRLTDADGDNIFTGTLDLPAGHSNLFTAKFGAWYLGIEVDAPGANGAIDNEAGFGADYIVQIPVDATAWDYVGRFGANNPANTCGLTITEDHLSGWNLVGLPVGVDDNLVTTIFPTSVEGTLYGFDGTYFSTDALLVGDGYWLFFDAVGTDEVTGDALTNLTVSLTTGWNLLSGISTSVDVAAIDDPGGIIVAGTIYGFDGTYFNSSSIDPMKGYWINASADGDITLSSGAVAKTRQTFVDRTEGANSLSFNGSNLFFGVEIPEEEIMSYSLPPKPPEGAFDVRFSSGWKVTEESGMINVQNNTDKLTISFNIVKEAGEHMRWVLTSNTGTEYELDGVGEIVVDGAVTEFSLNKVPEIPATFAISQNYPNPFNPVTNINYDLPKESFVTISVYNIMGQKVTDLVADVRPAGFHRVAWNSTNMSGESVSSGVYIYTITASDFRAVKKMVLMK